MNFEIPDGARRILQTLNSAGHEAYLVGGCVRDLLRGVEPNDWDICTSALPEETEQRGYSTASKALLDGAKLRALGWSANYDIHAGIRETIDILRELDGGERP